MEKLIYLVWDRPSLTPADLRARLIDRIAPQLLACSPRGLQMDIDDEDAEVRSMVAIPDDELPVRALVSIWLDAHDTRAEYEAILDAVGVRRAGYLVTESLYRDYGDNEHAPPRDWPDGRRSPGIVTLTVFDKPAGVTDEAFYGHWYGHQSPMSEQMQPRTCYVRNAVVRGAHTRRAVVPRDRRGGLAVGGARDRHQQVLRRLRPRRPRRAHPHHARQHQAALRPRHHAQLHPQRIHPQDPQRAELA